MDDNTPRIELERGPKTSRTNSGDSDRVMATSDQKNAHTDTSGTNSENHFDINGPYDSDFERTLVVDFSVFPTISVESLPDPNLMNPRKFDILEFLHGNGFGIADVEFPYTSIWQMIDVPLYEDRVFVSENLEMVHKDDNTWTGTITISNRTKLNISYIALSSESSFQMEPEVSWIAPNETFQVQVTTPHQFVKPLWKNERITILTAPVYHKAHLDLQLLKRWWKTPGSVFFSSCAFEWHGIRNIDYAYKRSIFNSFYNVLQLIKKFRARANKIIYPERLYDIPEADNSKVAKLLKNYELERRKVQAMKMEQRNGYKPKLGRSLLILLIWAATIGFGKYHIDFIYEEINRFFPPLNFECLKEKVYNCSWDKLDQCFYGVIQILQNGLIALANTFLVGYGQVKEKNSGC